MNTRNRSGFTMMEMMIVLVIMGVVAGLAVPAYFKTVEQARSNEAKTNLNIVHMGEKLYFLNNGTYASAANISAANTILNTDMASQYYDLFSLVGNAGGYTAVMKRNAASGGASSKTYTYTYATGGAIPTPVEGGSF